MPTAPVAARISIQNILFPTDFSAASSAALPFALTLVNLYGSTLWLAHAIPAEPHRQVVFDRLPAQDDQPGQAARNKLAELQRDRALCGISSKILLERGELQDVIPALILENSVDLVVLGTHGRRGVSKIVLGSNAEKIYRLASCPVLTVGPNAHGQNWGLRRILCPVDLAEHHAYALHYALSLAEESQAQLILLQAVPMVPWQHRPGVELRTVGCLEGLIPAEARDWCAPQFLVRWEHAAEAILLAAAQREADLIVMGVRKARAAGLSSHLPWPVASEVVGRAPCPVLTVRA
jgi:nucleotide-binding universal stress UspA family protein